MSFERGRAPLFFFFIFPFFISACYYYLFANRFSFFVPSKTFLLLSILFLFLLAFLVRADEQQTAAQQNQPLLDQQQPPTEDQAQSVEIIEENPFDTAPEPPQEYDYTAGPPPETPVEENPKLLRAINSRGFENSFLQKQKNKDEIEIEDRANKRNARFTRLSSLVPGASLGFEEVETRLASPSADAEPVSAYAIDPSQFSFQTGILTSVATGHFLYKCSDWNFYERRCPSEWRKIMDLVPGQEYSILLGPTDPAYSEADPLQNFNASDYYLPVGSVFAGVLGNTNQSDGVSFDIQESLVGPSKNATAVFQLSATATTPQYQSWDGDAKTWSATQSGQATGGGNVYWQVLKACPNRDERILVTLDSLSDIYAQTWNSTNWTARTALELTAQANTRQAYDLAYEQLSGDAIVAWANATVQSIWYRVWNGNAWSAVQSLTIGTAATANIRVKLYERPGSDDLMLFVETAVTSTYSDLYAARWNGNGFDAATQIDLAIATNTGQAFDGAWEPSGSEFVLFYANTSVPINYRNYSAGTWAAGRAGFSGGNGAVRNVRTASFPGTEEVMACWQEFAAADLDCQLWNATAVGTGKEQETTMEAYATTRNFDVAPVTSTSGGFVIILGDANDDWYDFFLCNSAANCFSGTYTTAANTPIALWSSSQFGAGVDTSWGMIEADPNNAGNLTLVGASQTIANGWYRNQIYCNSVSCYATSGNWVSLGGATTSVAYEAADLEFDAHQLFRAEAWHNSTPTSGIPSNAQVYTLNVTAKFNSTYETDYQLNIFNWTDSSWGQCASSAVTKDAWTVFTCNYSSGFADLRSPDSEKRIRISINETKSHGKQSLLKQDYLKFFMNWEAPPWYDQGPQGYGVNNSNPLPGEWIKFYSFWYDDSALYNHTLEWNATGSMQNQSWTWFAQSNASWANWTVQVPAGQEGKWLAGRIWANDSKNIFNSTPLSFLSVQNVSPSVSDTFSNASTITPADFFCVNASATDVGAGVVLVWATITFPNTTVINVSLSDTGCNAGGAGDGAYGALVNSTSTQGKLFINTTWANDSVGNTGFQTPFPNIAVRVSLTNYSSTTLRPNGTGTYAEWTTQYPATGNHFDKVNETTADGDSSYVESSTDNHRDSFELTDVPYSDAEIANVTVYFVAEKLTSATTNLASLIRTNGADYEGVSQSLTQGTYNVFSEFYNTNPQTGAEWTAAEVNALQAGVRLKSAKDARTTQVYVVVFHTTPPTVNATSANVSKLPANRSFCVNASAGWGSYPVDTVWATITFPNSTAANITLSDTGCNAGGTGDKWYGTAIDGLRDPGTLWVNQSWVNDSTGWLGSQAPSPNIKIIVGNAIGGSDSYVGFYGNLSFKLRNNTALGNELYSSEGNAGGLFVSIAASTPNWAKLKAADRPTDMPLMDTDIGLLDGKDLLENNYADDYNTMCGGLNLSVMNSSDKNWKIGVLYSDKDLSDTYSAGDNVLFCVQITSPSTNYLGGLSNYETAFPKAFANNVDFWHDLS